MILRENQTWEQARIEAQRAGIVLTRRPHKKGGFFCYAGKKLRQLPDQGYLLAGKIN